MDGYSSTVESNQKALGIKMRILQQIVFWQFIFISFVYSASTNPDDSKFCALVSQYWATIQTQDVMSDVPKNLRSPLLQYLQEVKDHCSPGLWKRIPQKTSFYIPMLFRHVGVTQEDVFSKIVAPCLASCQTEMASGLYNGANPSKEVLLKHRSFLLTHLRILNWTQFLDFGLTKKQMKSVLDSLGWTPEKIQPLNYFKLTGDTTVRQQLVDSIQALSSYSQAENMARDLVELKDRILILALVHKLWNSNFVLTSMTRNHQRMHTHIRTELAWDIQVAFLDSIPKCIKFEKSMYGGDLSYRDNLNGGVKSCNDRVSNTESTEDYKRTWNDFVRNWERFFKQCFDASINLNVPDSSAYFTESDDVYGSCGKTQFFPNATCLEPNTPCKYPLK